MFEFETVQNSKIWVSITQRLEGCRVNDYKFETSISQLLAEAGEEISIATADEILLYYRIKIACDLVANRASILQHHKSIFAATSRTQRSYAPLAKHILRIKGCKSSSEVNILNLSSLSILENDIQRLQNILDDFVEISSNQTEYNPKARRLLRVKAYQHSAI